MTRIGVFWFYFLKWTNTKLWPHYFLNDVFVFKKQKQNNPVAYTAIVAGFTRIFSLKLLLFVSPSAVSKREQNKNRQQRREAAALAACESDSSSRCHCVAAMGGPGCPSSHPRWSWNYMFRETGWQSVWKRSLLKNSTAALPTSSFPHEFEFTEIKGINFPLP